MWGRCVHGHFFCFHAIKSSNVSPM
jgi:hypothetical protein